MKAYEMFSAEFLIRCEYDNQPDLETTWGNIYIWWKIQ